MIDIAGFGSAVVVVILLGAVLGKLTSPRAWRRMAVDVAGGGLRRAVVLMVIVPITELALSVAILVSPARGLTGAAVLFATLAVGVQHLRQRLEGRSCACFGALLPGRIDGALVARNVVLTAFTAAVTVVVVAGGAQAPGAGEFLVAVPVALLVANLSRPAGRRLGPAVGEQAGIDGTGDGRSALVVILSPGCPACEVMASRVDDVRRLAGAERLVTVIAGGAEADRLALAERVGTTARLDLEDLAVMWQVPGTPYGVAVDAAGTIRGHGALHDEGLRVLGAVLNETMPASSRRDALALGVRATAALVAGATVFHSTTVAAIAAAAARRPAQAAPDRNTFRGGCRAFDTYVSTKGLWFDKFGQKGRESYHRDVMGNTLAWPAGDSQVNVAIKNRRRRVLKNVSGVCDCPNRPPPRFYFGQEQVTQCITDCPSGLGCFAWQCEWSNSRTCIQLLVDVEVAEPPLTITRMRWIPPDGATPRCKRYAKQVNSDTHRHERRHVADAQAAIAEIEKKYRSHLVYGCGRDEAEAQRELNTALAMLRERIKPEVVRKLNDKTDAFHRSDDGRGFEAQCQVCE